MTDLPRIKLKELVESIPEGLSPLERVVLAHDGTVQTLLAIISGDYGLSIQVINQTEVNRTISREVKLLSKGITIMEATSCIPIDGNTPEFIEAIRRKKSGIGQIINYLGLNTQRKIQSMDVSPGTLSRIYTITGECNVTIVEDFGRTSISQWGDSI